MRDIYKFQGRDLELTQEPYLDANEALEPIYKAITVDEEGYSFMLSWKVTDHDCEDESEACDWSRFKVRYLGML